jgi:murein DD-endopeptidase MepM/ murein hydrolase activator NlpD
MRKVAKIARSLVFSVVIFYLFSLFFTRPLLPPTVQKTLPSFLLDENNAFSSDFELGCIFSGTIEVNQPLAISLFKQGLPTEMISQITQSLSKVLDLKKCMPGDFFTLLASPDHLLLSFEYQKGLLERYKVINKEGDLVAYSVPIKLTRIVKGLEGEIRSSLWEDMRNKCENPELIMKFSDIFAWQIDFLNEPQRGDKYKLIYEEYEKNGKFVSYGDILAAEYEASGTKYDAILYQGPEGQSDYFDLTGKSLRKAFLRSPLNYRRITSTFSASRLHPVFKTYRPHYGVDYAAPYGTPVVSSADGVVIFAGWKRGLGKTIEIKHANGFVTSYGHLSSFALAISKGAKVNQGEMIGRVGASGIATGPHLDFRCMVGGRYVNPLKMNLPSARPVNGNCLPDFKSKKENLLYALNLLTDGLALASAK